jgi:hypothetical protein
MNTFQTTLGLEENEKKRENDVTSSGPADSTGRGGPCRDPGAGGGGAPRPKHPAPVLDAFSTSSSSDKVRSAMENTEEERAG